MTKPKEGTNTGNAGKGRPKGSPNRTTVALKEAILLAATEVGEDGRGHGALTGYMRGLARTEKKAFAALLGRVLPMTVVGDPNAPIGITVNIKQF